MSDKDFEVSIPDLVPTRYFFNDPIENLQLRITVKKVSMQMRRIVGPKIEKTLSMRERREKELDEQLYDELDENEKKDKEKRKQEKLDKLDADEKEEKEDGTKEDIKKDSDIVCSKIISWQGKEFSPREILTLSHRNYRPHTPLEDKYREIVKEKVISHMQLVLSTSQVIEEKKSLLAEIAEKRIQQAIQEAADAEEKEKEKETLGKNASQLSIEPKKLEEFSRKLVRQNGVCSLCTKVSEDGFTGVLNKQLTSSDNKDVNEFATNLLKSTSSADNKLFFVCFSYLLSTKEDDIKALPIVKNVGKEVILVRLAQDEKNFFSISPAFSEASTVGVSGTGCKFRIRSANKKNKFAEMEYEFWVENLNAKVELKKTPFELEKDAKRTVIPTAITGFFERAPDAQTLRVIYQLEIVRAVGFDEEQLYVAYEISLPPTWTLMTATGGAVVTKNKTSTLTERRHALSSVTQTSRAMIAPAASTKYEGGNYGTEIRTYAFCFPVEIEASVSITSEITEFPTIYFQISSMDYWGRTAAVGYGNCKLSSAPGVFSHSVDTWRPIGTVFEETTRFFLGGTPLLTDIKLSGIPSEFNGTFFNRYGFETENSGSLEIRYNSIHFRNTNVRKTKREKELALAGVTI